MTIRTAPVALEHREAWERLYAGYAAFYGREQTPAMRDRVWGWLMDADHAVEGLVALDGEGRVVGLAHYRAFARPLAAETGGFLDDLFVDPAARRGGAATALFEAAAEVARARGWTVLRWITQETNYPGRALYDRLAVRTGWVTYDMGVENG